MGNKLVLFDSTYDLPASVDETIKHLAWHMKVNASTVSAESWDSLRELINDLETLADRIDGLSSRVDKEIEQMGDQDAASNVEWVIQQLQEVLPLLKQGKEDYIIRSIASHLALYTADLKTKVENK